VESIGGRNRSRKYARQEVIHLQVEYPLLSLFHDFFARSTRGIIR
jgi:UDP-N-acetylglucosamine acyltransferase